MVVNGILTGLSLKSSPNGRIVEVKVVASYNQAILDNLGPLFGKAVAADVEARQLEFEGAEGQGE